MLGIKFSKHEQHKFFLLDFFVHLFLLLFTLLLSLFFYLVDFLRHFKHCLFAIFLGCLRGPFSLLSVVFDQLLTQEKNEFTCYLPLNQLCLTIHFTLTVPLPPPQVYK